MKTTFKQMWIRIGSISAHPKVQRKFTKAHAESIAADFDPEKFGDLYVVPNPRHPGRYLAFDGQHRLYAAEKALGPEQQVHCRVYEDRSVEELASITLGVNNQKSWRAIDSFMQRLNAREEQACAIQAVLEKRGLRVGAAPGVEGMIRASAACDWVMEKAGGAPALDRVAVILLGAWGKDQDAFHQDLIRAVALLCNRYDGALRDPDLMATLRKQSGPALFLGRARDYSKVLKSSASRAAAMLMARDYNRRKSTHRLPDWKE